MTDQTQAQPASDGPEALAAARFQLFAVLFALATVLYHRWAWFTPQLEVLPLVAAFAVLLRPAATPRFLALAALQTVFAYRDLPDANTNRTLQVFLSVTLVAAWVLARARAPGRTQAERESNPASPPTAAFASRWQTTFEPALRLQLLAVYFWAFFHKLNTDFFNVELSCGVELYLRVTEKVGLLPWPTGPRAMGAVVIATVVVEGLLPALLAWRRTRVVGLVLAAGMHFGFGLTMFYDFSMTMLALLSLYLPPGLARVLIAQRWLDPRAALGVSRPVWTALTTTAAVVFAVATQLIFWDMFDVFALAWWSLLGLYAWIALTWWRTSLGRTAEQAVAPYLRPSPWIAPIPLALFLMGTCPYIGSKTETSLAMYSNLRTEGGSTNHLIVPRPIALFGYQTDLVWVDSSSAPELQALAEEGHPVPVYVLRKRLFELESAGVRNIALTLRREAEPIGLTAAERDPVLGRAPTYFERKFLRFRTILPADANVCSH